MIPYRIEIISGWADDIRVNSFGPCSMIVARIHPFFAVSERSGLASSTHKAIENNKLSFLRHVFPTFYANYIYKKEIFAGSQDAYGICLPGVNVLRYNSSGIPHKVTTLTLDAQNFLLDCLKLRFFKARNTSYNPIQELNCSTKLVTELDNCTFYALEAIRFFNKRALIDAMRHSFRIQSQICPEMSKEIPSDSSFVKFSGAGMGFYFADVEKHDLKYKII